MREQRKPEFTISLKKRGKKTVKILFFPSSEWSGAPQGCYRIMVDGVWWGGIGTEKTFYNRPDCQNFMLGLAMGDDAQSSPPEGIAHGTRISVFTGRYFPDGTPEYYGSFAFGEPFRGYDGEWYVPTSMLEKGGVMAPVRNVIVQTKRV